MNEFFLSGGGGGQFAPTQLVVVSGTTNFPAALAGSWYKVSVFGEGSSAWIGGVAGVGRNVANGQLLYCWHDAAAGTEAEVGAYWFNGPGEIVSIDGGVGMAFEASQKPVASGFYPMPPMPYAMTIPADCTESEFSNEVNPTSEQTLSIKKKPHGSSTWTEFATCTVSTAGAATWSGAETLIAAGDIIGIGGFPASQDATWAGIAMTLKGARTI